MKLETKRLNLREWKDSDKESLIENINNINVTKNLLVVPYPYTKKDAEWWINRCKENSKRKNKDKYDFAIILKSGKEAIGGIGLDNIDKFQGIAEVGYWLGEKYWRQGLMSEALEEILNFAFNNLKLRRITLYAFVENIASNELAKKLGFRFEGMHRKVAKTKSDGRIHDSNAYGLLKDEV